MVTLNQLVKKKTIRYYKKRRFNLLNLEGCPQKKGVCMKISMVKPKKPNSAIRKIARIKLSNNKLITAYIPGQGHNLQKHSVVMVRGGRTKDLPGLRYKLIRGLLDFNTKETFGRKQSLSKYGYKTKNTNK